MKSRETATLSSKFQISIPKSIRTAQQWQAGQVFAFVPRGGSIMLVPVPEFKDLLGIARGANTDNYRDRNDRF